MQKVFLIFMLGFSVIFLFNFSGYAVFDEEDHFTTDCSPLCKPYDERKTVFYPGEKLCHVTLGGSAVIGEWYKPDGSFYGFSYHAGISYYYDPYGNVIGGCAYESLKDYEAPNIPGEWRFDYTYGVGSVFFSTYFTILDITSTTTSSISTTTARLTTSSTTTTKNPNPETSTTSPSTIDSSTTTTSSEHCGAKEIYGEDSEEVEILRYFRDNILSQTPTGREIIKLYYQWSPVIVKAMEEDEGFREDVKEMIDGVLGFVGE